MNLTCSFLTALGNEIAGYVTLKHIYEIAVIKSEDPCWKHFSLERICNSIISTARSCGIEVVPHLDSKEYAVFLEERKAIVEAQKQELQDIKAARLLRVVAWLIKDILKRPLIKLCSRIMCSTNILQASKHVFITMNGA